ncbi:hypothetical protein MKW92_033884 [Papaver armeniacum]|nr:hypothetical protein MKW92_033884 [Papaver armeniacum]
MIADLADWVRPNDFSSDEDDDEAFYCGENDDYNFWMSSEESESDGDEGDPKGTPQVRTGIFDATTIGDENRKSEVSGKRMDTQLNFQDQEKGFPKLATNT